MKRLLFMSRFLIMVSTIWSFSLDTMNIHQAVITGNLKRVREIITFNLDEVNSLNHRYSRETPLHNAAIYGHTNIAQFLLNHGASVDALNEIKETPLHWVANTEHIEIAQLLLKYKAHVNIQNCVHQTSLHIATWFCNIELVQLLLSNKASVNIQTLSKNTPLHLAIQAVHIGLVNLLLKHGTLVNSQDWFKSTPLHCAAEKGNISLIKILLENGADINSTDLNKDTPSIVATNHRHKKAAQLIIDWPYYIQFRNRQIAAFLAVQEERAGQFSPAYNTPRDLLNRITQVVRSEWKFDSVEQIHEIAIKQQKYEDKRLHIRCLIQ